MNDREVKSLSPEGKWSVPYQDDGYWRTGIYLPEFDTPGAITRLEKHSCPELFVCLNGKMGLLLMSEGRERSVELDHGDSLLVTEYHNGYRIDQRGFFLVVERTDFTTEYVDR